MALLGQSRQQSQDTFSGGSYSNGSTRKFRDSLVFFDLSSLSLLSSAMFSPQGLTASVSKTSRKPPLEEVTLHSGPSLPFLRPTFYPALQLKQPQNNQAMEEYIN